MACRRRLVRNASPDSKRWIGWALPHRSVQRLRAASGPRRPTARSRTSPRGLRTREQFPGSGGAQPPSANSFRFFRAQNWRARLRCGDCKGLADDLADRHYAVLKTADGRLTYTEFDRISKARRAGGNNRIHPVQAQIRRSGFSTVNVHPPSARDAAIYDFPLSPQSRSQFSRKADMLREAQQAKSDI